MTQRVEQRLMIDGEFPVSIGVTSYTRVTINDKDDQSALTEKTQSCDLKKVATKVVGAGSALFGILAQSGVLGDMDPSTYIVAYSISGVSLLYTAMNCCKRESHEQEYLKTDRWPIHYGSTALTENPASRVVLFHPQPQIFPNHHNLENSLYENL